MSKSATKERRFSIRLSLPLQELPTVKEGQDIFHENKIAGVSHRFCAEYMNLIRPVFKFVTMEPHEYTEKSMRTKFPSFCFVDPQVY